MAGDWIKMRGNLWDDPRVAKIVDITDSSEAAVVGALYWLWSTADQHTTDGVMLGLTLRAIDRKTGVAGFADALCAIGWIADHPEGIRIIDFETHNGVSAKKRCQTAKRVANHTATNAPLTQEDEKTNATSVSTALAREEKRREEEEKDLLARKEREQADADERARLEAEGFKPTAAGAVCRAMRQAGLMSSNPGDPRLLALLAQGAAAVQRPEVQLQRLASGQRRIYKEVLGLQVLRLHKVGGGVERLPIELERAGPGRLDEDPGKGVALWVGKGGQRKRCAQIEVVAVVGQHTAHTQCAKGACGVGCIVQRKVHHDLAQRCAVGAGQDRKSVV